MSETGSKSVSLPEKLVVTLRAGGAFFAIANIICVAILAWAYLSVKLEPKALAHLERHGHRTRCKPVKA